MIHMTFLQLMAVLFLDVIFFWLYARMVFSLNRNLRMYLLVGVASVAVKIIYVVVLYTLSLSNHSQLVLFIIQAVISILLIIYIFGIRLPKDLISFGDLTLTREAFFYRTVSCFLVMYMIVTISNVYRVVTEGGSMVIYNGIGMIVAIFSFLGFIAYIALWVKLLKTKRELDRLANGSKA
tara:strand:+ start:48 stop:587 length:540 start_codon:yes stop_codon:yes gene_type:complete